MYLMSAPAMNAFSPAPGQHDAADGVVARDPFQGIAQGVRRFDVERVQRIRAIHGDDRDAALAADADAHATATLPRRNSTISAVGPRA